MRQIEFRNDARHTMRRFIGYSLSILTTPIARGTHAQMRPRHCAPHVQHSQFD
jgi:hypothetical protein